MANLQQDYEPVKQSIEDLVRLTGKNHQNLLLGDTHHQDNGIARFVSRQDTMVALAESGVTHLFLEFPVWLQHLADAYADGVLTKDAFADQMASRYNSYHHQKDEARERYLITATMIDNAKKAGIQTHFIDGGEGSFSPLGGLRKKMEEAEVDYQKKYKIADSEFVGHFVDKKNASQIQNHVRQYFAKNYPEISDPLEKYVKALVQARIAGDPALADRINEIAKGEKSAIFYGVQHGLSNKDDLDEHLDGRSMKITLEGKGAEWRSWDLQDKPDVIYNVVTNRTLVDKSNADLRGLERDVSSEKDTPQVMRKAPSPPIPAPS